jgi:hypothetical protein
MAAIYRYCCAWCLRTSLTILPLSKLTTGPIDDSDDELYEPLMDDNESNAISDLLLYLENVPSQFSPTSLLMKLIYL